MIEIKYSGFSLKVSFNGIEARIVQRFRLTAPYRLTLDVLRYTIESFGFNRDLKIHSYLKVLNFDVEFRNRRTFSVNGN